jgi:hypothetical protein
VAAPAHAGDNIRSKDQPARIYFKKSRGFFPCPVSLLMQAGLSNQQTKNQKPGPPKK